MSHRPHRLLANFRRCALLCGCAALTFAQADTRIWKPFLAWLAARPASVPQSELVAPYRDYLIQHGKSPAAAARAMDVIWRGLFRRPDALRTYWNKIYDADSPIFVKTPSGFVVAAVANRRPGKALDVGMGQGRNSVFLAMRGWDVTGIDPSDEAVRHAGANAVKAGVKLHAVLATDDQYNFGAARWDLIVFTYVRDATDVDVARFYGALAPGGAVLYENGVDESGRVLAAFKRVFPLISREVVTATPDWNPSRKTRLERVVAEKTSTSKAQLGRSKHIVVR